jgi:GNAT superfamily N-acetyltransferase
MMFLNIRLEKATNIDAQAIFDIQVKAFKPLLEKYKDYQTNPANETVERVITRINNPNGGFYKIIVENNLVGAICARWKENFQFWISPMFILPAYQGKGIAQKVLGLVEEMYPQAGSWELATILEEERNCYLYEKMGYTKTGTQRKLNENTTLIFYKKLKGNKLNPIGAAQQFIQKHFPYCDCALLAGSVVRGEATETSDLDIVIFDRRVQSSYRESLIDLGWNIEVFVHNLISYKHFFKSDCERARPSLPRMVSEGIIIKDFEKMGSIKHEANELLEKGPEEWTKEMIKIKRYFITDVLDDFIGCTNRSEEIFIASTLAELVSEFVLRTNGKWIGTSKWLIRSLKDYDERFAEHFVQVFDTFYKTGEKDKIIKMVDSILQPHGGRLFNGFSLGKE